MNCDINEGIESLDQIQTDSEGTETDVQSEQDQADSEETETTVQSDYDQHD